MYDSSKPGFQRENLRHWGGKRPQYDIGHSLHKRLCRIVICISFSFLLMFGGACERGGQDPEASARTSSESSALPDQRPGALQEEVKVSEEEIPQETGEISKKAQDNLRKLLGKWSRTDGNYTLEVRGVQSNKKLEVEYYNPQPINIAKTKLLRKGDDIGIFVKLDDKNYSGSMYNLVYNPELDKLGGTYYHAVSKQYFQVVFNRK